MELFIYKFENLQTVLMPPGTATTLISYRHGVSNSGKTRRVVAVTWLPNALYLSKKSMTCRLKLAGCSTLSMCAALGMTTFFTVGIFGSVYH